jgi:hypothetical protein
MGDDAARAGRYGMRREAAVCIATASSSPPMGRLRWAACTFIHPWVCTSKRRA